MVTVGPLVCPECGADSVKSHRPSSLERLRYWLWNGGSAPTTMICVQGHQWPGGGGRTLTYGGSSRRWVLVPFELARVVYRERSMVPVPLTYLVAALVGIGCGVVADLVIGWPWWLVAGAFVAAVWVFFLASALWGPGRSLGDDLWMVIDPVPGRGTAARSARRRGCLRSDCVFRGGRMGRIPEAGGMGRFDPARADHTAPRGPAPRRSVDCGDLPDRSKRRGGSEPQPART